MPPPHPAPPPPDPPGAFRPREVVHRAADAVRRLGPPARDTGASAVRLTRRIAGSRATHRIVRATIVVLVGLLGAVLGLLLGGHAEHDVGPFRANFALTPAWSGETVIVIPPLGSLTIDSHAAPMTLTVTLGALDQKRIQALVADPDGVEKASVTAMSDVEDAMYQLVLQATGAALLGALLLAALAFRDTRRTAVAGSLALTLMAGTILGAVSSLRPTAIEEPRYEGLLVNAPAVVGDARRIADRYEEYRSELQRLVRNVSKLYITASHLPVYEPDPDTIRVLHVSDLHLNPASYNVIAAVVEQFSIDVVVDTGDLTDWGSEQEAAFYAAGIRDLKVPYVYIRGNHDSAITAAAVRAQPNAVVLEGGVATVAGLTFAGIGDPRFTPDKTPDPPDARGKELMAGGLRAHGQQLADIIREQRKPVDMAMVHDPKAAPALAGVVPVVLAGHMHKRAVKQLDDKTLLMTQGSTGGAGLRMLDNGDTPTPLALSVLYFSKDRKLQAYDDVTVGGAGQSEVALQRHILDEPPGKDIPPPSPSATPTPTAAPSGRRTGN